ncbi:EamA family transporter [Paenibacillus sp. FSL H8-0034]|uniref:EamA family transporter n=1 Tax=Paenibacillus sp. FSL H8-0034 TaxID=2954671 RepID=UPI004046FD27
MGIILLSVFVVLLNGVCQIFLKIGAEKSKLTANSNLFVKFLNSYSYILIGYFGFVCITILTTYLLKFFPLKTLTTIMSSNYVITSILAFIILKEKITTNKLLGILLILIGIIVYHL